MRLGVNIDHIATIREARKISYPDPVDGALIVESAGADGITVHLRQDRRHIKERDVELLKRIVSTHLNVELSLNEEILGLILKIHPDACCLVPERVEEITTEGGLDIISNLGKVKTTAKRLKDEGIFTTIFIEPDENIIKRAPDCGVDAVEINTGKYSEVELIRKDFIKGSHLNSELERIQKAAFLVRSLGLEVHAGHGLNYKNVSDIVKIPEIEELNIGHSIIGRAIFVGLENAVKEMLALISSCNL